MPLRQIEVVIPKEGKDAIDKLLEEEYIYDFWQDGSELHKGYLIKVLVDANQTEAFLDKAEELLGNLEKYRLVMLAVEATLPRIESEEDQENNNTEKKDPENPWDKPLQGVRVSREELYSDIADGVSLSGVYLMMVVLSTIVAALGLLRDNTAVVIGAMVIAPLLAPNVGLALSVSLADLKLGLKSLKTGFSGLSLALFLSVVMGLFVNVGDSSTQILLRTEVHYSDIALALASGSAGVLAYTLGMSAAVIGVMVAVALLPPLVAAGLLFGDGQFEPGLFALLLLMINIICVNLAATTTFMIQGIRPRSWYESKKAERANKFSLAFWLLLLLMLTILIYYFG